MKIYKTVIGIFAALFLSLTVHAADVTIMEIKSIVESNDSNWNSMGAWEAPVNGIIAVDVLVSAWQENMPEAATWRIGATARMQTGVPIALVGMPTKEKRGSPGASLLDIRAVVFTYEGKEYLQLEELGLAATPFLWTVTGRVIKTDYDAAP